MNTLGVLVTCYNEVRALEFSLPMFRKIYPHSKIYLTTESSNTNFDSLLSLNHIKINHVEDTMYIIKEVNDQNFVEPYFQEKILLATRAFLTRVKQAIEFCQSDYLLLMDPDTLVRGPLSFPEGAKLLGSRINWGLPSALRTILAQTPGAIDINCWGATPAIIHCETFLKSYRYVMEQDLTFLPRITQTFYAIFAHDVILPILFALQGEREIYNPEIIECNRNPFWMHTNHPLVHQFKYLYDNNRNGTL